ncbi:MAG: HD domain-containing protein [Candidatus Brocadiales bacterium]|nr:HD domain-containing protein [Candidatus Brocadiales bacterium]
MLKFSLSEIMRSLSETLDLVFFGLGVDWGSMSHSSKVCYISCKIAEQMNLDKVLSGDLYYASLLHDVGLILTREAEGMTHFEAHEDFLHCKRGYEILKKCSYTERLSNIILHHHDKWAGPNESGATGNIIPICSRIIYIADRIDVLIRPREYILHQKTEIVNTVNKYSGIYFDPQVVAAFNQIARLESFWLDLTTKHTEDLLQNYKFKENIRLDYDELGHIAEIFAHIVDSKSKFTLEHSHRVAMIANALARKLKFSPFECEIIKVAGLLHDLGKLAIPDEILDKSDKLSDDEFEIMKRHTYFTNLILKKVRGLDTIAQWAAFHHERLDGSGYPFHTKGEIIPLGARILAVSDVFTALTEDRPYRKGYTKEVMGDILNKYVSVGALDNSVVNIAVENIDKFYELIHTEERP